MLLRKTVQGDARSSCQRVAVKGLHPFSSQALGLSAVCVLAVLAGCLQKQPQKLQAVVALNGRTMGTTYSVKVVPFDGMPDPAQWIAEVLPMTHFMRLIRGVVLRGASLQELSGELLILGGFILVAMTVAVSRFHKRLD